MATQFKKTAFFSVIFLTILSCHLLSEVHRIDTSGLTVLTPTESIGSPLPNTTTMMPGVYTYQGLNYDCTEEGLYRFYTIHVDHKQRIVHHSGIENLLHSVSWMHAHGYRDTLLNFSEAAAITKNDRVHLICGNISVFATTMLAEYGYSARNVVFLTLNPWNDYNNGHTMIEVKENGTWKLWDIDLRNYFQRGASDLNAKDFLNAVQANDYEILSFSKSPVLCFGDLVYGSYDYSFHFEGLFLFENRLKEEYKHCAGILLIQLGSNFYFTTKDPVIRKRVENYTGNFIWMDEVTWLNTFYPEGS